MGETPHQPINYQAVRHPLTGHWSRSGFANLQQRPFVNNYRGTYSTHSYFQSPYQQLFPSFQYAYSAPYNFMTSSPPRGQGLGQSNPGPFDMNTLRTTLGQTTYQQPAYPSELQRPQGGNVQSTTTEQPSYGGLSSINNGQEFQQHHQLPLHNGQYYGRGTSGVSQQQTVATQRPSPAYFSGQMMPGHQQHQQQQDATSFFYPPTTTSYPSDLGLHQQIASGNYLSPQVSPPVHNPEHAHAAYAQVVDSTEYTHTANAGPSTARGPPRKPRQTGFAIWIGNLPPQTNLMHLVHHVCKEAPGLESLFLISKSNCAFANFKDESTCTAAQQKLHDSKFQAIRLVSRLRKSTVEGATGITAPTGPSASAPQHSAGVDIHDGDPHGQGTVGEGRKSLEDDVTVVGTSAEEGVIGDGSGEARKDKFFVLKSLTVEDLELSVRTGIWATQSHNEDVLNKAFASADGVYLIFSANKSGEYFGYAKMTSRINEDPAAAIEFAPKAQTTPDADLPKAIPTEPTDFAPRGRIIDDSARGTIFWEVEHDDDAATINNTDANADADLQLEDTEALVPADIDGEDRKAWGKPFKLEWLSTNRLPFYRCRGLRNPWNSNREVKIARDGTELESSVGRRLIGLFNRVQSPPSASLVGVMGQHQSMPGAMMMMGGFPPPPQQQHQQQQHQHQYQHQHQQQHQQHHQYQQHMGPPYM